MYKHFINNPSISDYIIIIPTQINDLSIDIILPELENTKSHINICDLPSKKKKTVIPKLNTPYVAEINLNNTISMKYMNPKLSQQHLHSFLFRKKIIKFLEQNKISTQTINYILQQSHEFPPDTLEDTYPSKYILNYFPNIQETQEICEKYNQNILLQSTTSFKIFSQENFKNTLKSIKQINQWATKNLCQPIQFIKSPLYEILIISNSLSTLEETKNKLHEYIKNICHNNNTTLLEISNNKIQIIDKN